MKTKLCSVLMALCLLFVAMPCSGAAAAALAENKIEIGAVITDGAAFSGGFAPMSVDNGEAVTYYIEKGQTLSFENISLIEQNITGINQYVDYVLYYKDGSVKEYYANRQPGTLSVPAGGRAVITASEKAVSPAIADDYFLINEEEAPVFHKITMKLYETCTYTNNSTVAYNVMYRDHNSGYCYDYVLYDADGNVSTYKQNALENINVPAGYSVKITQTGKYKQEFNALYDKFDLTRNDEPVMQKISLSPGETCTYTNNSTVAYNVMYYGSGSYRYDYVIYYSNDKVKSSGSDFRDTMSVPGGGKVKITQKGNYVQEFSALYEYFDVTNHTAAPTTYMATNIDTVDAVLKPQYNCDYIVYDANNVISAYNVETTENITVPRGGYALVTVNINSTAPFEENEAFSIEEYNTPAYQTTRVKPGETYCYTNKGTKELKVYNNGRLCDYVIHNADGSILSYAQNTSDNSFTVPVGGNIYITSDYYLHLKGIYSCFEVEKKSDPVFSIIGCERGETWRFVNDAAKDINLILTDTIYDYVIYNADSSVLKGGVDRTNTSISVPSGCSCVITPLVGDTSVYALKEAFNMVSKRSYPVMKRVSLDHGKTLTLQNASDENRTLYNIQGQYINYATFDAGDNAQKAEEFVSPSSITVPASGRIELTMLSSNATFAGLYEFFSDEDLTVHVSDITLSDYYILMKKGRQKLISATILPTDATNKTIVWSSSNPSVVTVAQTGKITAKNYGTATVTATAADGGLTASCEVVVSDSAPIAVKGISLNRSTLKLNVGEKDTLTATITPSDATNRAINWASSDISVATVTNGVVTAQKEGTTTITATTADGGYSATCRVTVIKPTTPSGTISTGNISFNLTLSGDVGQGKVYAAIYGANGRLKSIKPYAATKNVAVSFDSGVTGAYIKVMWWSDNMLPMCAAQTIPLQ